MIDDDNDKPKLVVYPQRTYHHNAYLVGNSEGLRALRNAIDEALTIAEDDYGVSVCCAIVEPFDHETYSLAVVVDNDVIDEITAYWQKDDLMTDNNSFIPNERYIMAVGAYFERKKSKKPVD